MKFIKGAVVLLVLCLAAYGTYALFNQSPQLNVCESDFAYLEKLGIHIQDGQVADTGLSGILSDVEGVPAIGAMDSSFGGGGSSTPPSFLGSSAPPSFLTEPTTSPTPSPFADVAPRVAAANLEAHSTPGFSQPAVDVLPPLDFFDPVDLPIQVPIEAPSTLPAEVPLIEAPLPFEVFPLEAQSFETVPLETVPLGTLANASNTSPTSTVESPPPWAENWDGPAQGIPVTPPPAELLHSLTPPPVLPSPIANTLADASLPAHEQAASPSSRESIRRIEGNIRRIETEVVSIPAPAALEPPVALESREQVLSSQDTIPLEVATLSSSRYIRTSSRQPLTFEPARPAVSPTAPVVAFAPPRQPHQPPPSDQAQPHLPPQPSQSQSFEPLRQSVSVGSATESPMASPIAANHAADDPVATSPVAASPATINSAVSRIAAPRLIESVPPPVGQSSVQPAVRETPAVREKIEQFIQSQRQLAESGDPENIRQAFVHLSKLYELEQLEDAERAMMHPILDVLALRVIYARETHILEPPYRVKPGETLESIARDFNLTPALLRRINGLAVSQELSAGTMLKVVYGQFDARISLQRRELTLLLGGLYAGRFPFSLPNENLSARRGEFFVTNRTDRMLVLNNGWVLAFDNVREATIAFADRDAREIFDILSEKSVIVVD